jgi:hypothetical protein
VFTCLPHKTTYTSFLAIEAFSLKSRITLHFKISLGNFNNNVDDSSASKFFVHHHLVSYSHVCISICRMSNTLPSPTTDTTTPSTSSTSPPALPPVGSVDALKLPGNIKASLKEKGFVTTDQFPRMRTDQ